MPPESVMAKWQRASRRAKAAYGIGSVRMTFARCSSRGSSAARTVGFGCKRHDESHGRVGVRKTGNAVSDPCESAVPVLAPVTGDDDKPITACVGFPDAPVRVGNLETCRPLQRVDTAVAGDEDLRARDGLADQILGVHPGRSEVEGREARDELAVQLLRKRAEDRPAGPEAGLDVDDGDSEMERRECRSHRGTRVAVDENGARITAVENLLDRRDGGPVVAEAPHAEVFEAS
jgi:hypothetical protein